MQSCQENNISFATSNFGCGIPACFDRGLERAYEEIDCPIDEISRKDKIYSVKCKKCKLYKNCEGIWRAYAQIYGLNEFNPL